MLYDGWLLRFAGGYTKRANSANVRYPSTIPLREKIIYCQRIYAQQGLPTLFRVPAPFSSEQFRRSLDEAKFCSFDPTLVLGRPLVESDKSMPGLTAETLTSEAWISLRATLTGTSEADWEMHHRILDCIVPEKCLMGLFYKDQPVACGMGVVEESLLGFFSIYTLTAQRRQGFGRKIMAALTQWGIKHGAAYGYLQVEGDNQPALAMYAKLGFERLYEYTYWKKIRENAK
jgi:ribosomal protein S18 acetylase RimI-like enzyme